MKEHVKAYLEKAGYAVNTVAADILWKADDWYRIRETDDHRRVTVSGERYSLARMGFAKRAAADDANLCEVVEINAGSNDEAVHEILAANRFDTQYREQLELTSAEGTSACYVRLEDADVMSDGTLSGGRICLNYIGATGFLPLTVRNGEIVEAAFCGEALRGAQSVDTLVICTLDPVGNYRYKTVIFTEDGEAGSEQTVRLGNVRPFAVMRTAEVNSIDGMQGYGYPKVYGAIPVFLGLDAAFSALLDELDLAAWDGYRQEDSTVLDGESFSLNVAFEDGSGIDAVGTNSFPDGYYEKKGAIQAFFEALMREYEIDADKIGYW